MDPVIYMGFYITQGTKIIAPKAVYLAHKKHFELQSKCRELIVPNLFYVQAVCNDETAKETFKLVNLGR